MEALSPFHLIIILAVIVLLFGGKKIPEVMRGLGEGIRNFKDGMNSPHPTSPSANPPANPPAATRRMPPTPTATEEKKYLRSCTARNLLAEFFCRRSR